MLTLKIVYITPSFIPSRVANSIHVMKMCQAFAKNGHDTTLLAVKNNTEPHIDNLYEYYGVKSIFRLKRLRWFPIKGMAYYNSVFAAMKARFLSPDLVYCRSIKACYFASLLGMKTVLECHQPIEDTGKVSQWMFNRIIRHKKLQKLVVITMALETHYLRFYNIAKDRIVVAPDAADPINPKLAKSAANTDRLTVGYVGHLYKGRGIDIIVEVAKKVPSAVFHIIGGNEKDIQYWKEETKNLKNIVYHGFVPPKTTDGLKMNCDVLLAPYQNKVFISSGGDTARWMSPLKIFEYMATGKIMIVSRLPVLQEVLTENKNCLMCEPNNLEEWTQKLKMVIDNPEAYNHLGANAKKLFEEKYTWDARGKEIINQLK